jgi:uncharacterized membrane protein
MRPTSLRPPDENQIEGAVAIQRPVEDVFSFYQDFTNLPRFLGDVMAVKQVGPATFEWTIKGPFGIRVNSTIRLTEMQPNKLIRYQTVGIAGLKGSWEVHFAPGSERGETDVRAVMKIPFGRLTRAALALIGKFPAEEQSSNLHRLKQLLETGRVTDTSYAVKGKFEQR